MASKECCKRQKCLYLILKPVWQAATVAFTTLRLCVRWLFVTCLMSAVNEILSTKHEVALKITHNLLHWPSYICQSIQTKMKLQTFVDFNIWAKFRLHLPSYIWQSNWTYGTVIKILIFFLLISSILKNYALYVL